MIEMRSPAFAGLFFAASFKKRRVETSHSTAPLCSSNALEQFGGEDKFCDVWLVGSNDLMPVAFPGLDAIFEKDDVVSDLHNRIHIVGIDHRGDAIFLGDLAHQIVNDHSRLWIETRIGLVAEEVLGVHGYGTGNGYTFHHSA